MSTYTYVGEELDLFSAATNWKGYFRSRLNPYLGSDVLEVGAGLGGTTRLLCRGTESRWVCLEPDPALAEQLKAEQARGTIPANCRVEVGTLETLGASAGFDTLLYIDVLEHIEDDAAEVIRAAERLAPGGHVIALSPAHQWLYSPFDKAIGHYRRYTKSTLAALTPPSLELVRLIYLDSVGLLASAGNRMLLKSSMPNKGQIALWDRVMVRVSKGLDPLLGYSVGKSVLGVWRKRPEQ
jgi:SAM-dependent methyltransferase